MIVYDGNLKDTTDRVSEKYLEINSVGAQSVSSFRTVRRKGRKDFSLFYIENGEYVFKKGNENVILKPGGFFIYPPFVPQDYSAEGKGSNFWIHFSGSAVNDLLCDAELSESLFFEGCSASTDIIKLFGKTLFDFNTNGIGREAVLIGDLIAIIAALGREPYREKSASDERLAPVVAMMHRDFRENREIEEYAMEYGVSKSRFIHVFGEKMGRSPYAYLISLRLKKATELLLETKIPISQIAYEIGFSYPLNFSRIFKKYYGASPENYRKNASES